MRRHILVIEDDPMLLETISMILKKRGYTVFEACNGKEAFAALEERDYDLILTDLMLPYANGLELLNKIKNDQRHKDSPVVIISAVDNEDIISEGFGSGADDYLRKPFVPGELVSRINRLLTKNKNGAIKNKPNFFHEPNPVYSI